MLHRAKQTSTTAEMWVVVVTKKLELSRKNYTCFCENNVLSENTAEMLIEGICTQLGVTATYEPLANGEQVTEEDLETGFEMLALLMYCPWNNFPDICAIGAKGCRTGCKNWCNKWRGCNDPGTLFEKALEVSW